GSWQETQAIVLVEERALSSNKRLPSATLVGVRGLSGGVGTNVGLANFALRVATSSGAGWAPVGLRGGRGANVATAARPSTALAAKARPRERRAHLALADEVGLEAA